MTKTAVKKETRKAEEFSWTQSNFDERKHKNAKSIIEKLPKDKDECNMSLQELVCNMIDHHDPEAYEKSLNMIKRVLDTAVIVLEKTGNAIEIDDMRKSAWRYPCFKSKVDDAISYSHLFKFSFQYAGIVWLKRYLKLDQCLDYATLYLLKQIDNRIMYNIGAWMEPIDFKNAADQFLIKRIDGSSEYNNVEVNPLNVIQSSYAELYLMLPLMDARVMKLHEEIYNAFLNADVAAFKAIIKA